jgi:hypothetical protein
MGYKVKLTELQRAQLVELVRNGKQQAKVIMHANILLQADCSSEGPSLKAKVIAKNLNVHERTVHRVRRKYAEEGLRYGPEIMKIEQRSFMHFKLKLDKIIMLKVWSAIFVIWQ